MIITTTLSVEGRTVSEYLGIVSAAQVMVMPGGNKGVQRGWQAGVDGATEILLQQAASLGADAVVGVSYTPFGMNICATRDSCPLNLSPYSDTLWIGYLYRIHTVPIPRVHACVCARSCAHCLCTCICI